jgi:hypothetical protein
VITIASASLNESLALSEITTVPFEGGEEKNAADETMPPIL